MQQTDPRDAQIAALREALKGARMVMVVACGTEAPYIRVALGKIDAALATAPAAKQESER